MQTLEYRLEAAGRYSADELPRRRIRHRQRRRMADAALIGSLDGVRRVRQIRCVARISGLGRLSDSVIRFCS